MDNYICKTNSFLRKVNSCFPKIALAETGSFLTSLKGVWIPPRRNFPLRGNSVNILFVSSKNRSSHRTCSVKRGILRNFANFTRKHLWQSLFYTKETLAQAFSCEFCEISKNTFFYRTPPDDGF